MNCDVVDGGIVNDVAVDGGVVNDSVVNDVVVDAVFGY